MLIIRQEIPEDVSAIRHVNEQAFDSSQEAALVDALRDAAHPFLSLVAVEDNQVVGHISFSPVTIEGGSPARPAMGLAPMSVLPEHQRRGIGSQLVHTGLEECRQLGCEIVVVLGHPEYYPRFGFRPAGEQGLRSEYEVPEEAFMVKELRQGTLNGMNGLVKYHAVFSSI
jgi:putative acetyltransferase